MTPKATPIHSVDQQVRIELVAAARARMARYSLTSALVLPMVEGVIAKAENWSGLSGPLVRIVASREEADSMYLETVETALANLSRVEGMEGLTSTLRDNPVQFSAVASEFRAAEELLKERLGCKIRFAPRGKPMDIVVTSEGGDELYVEVKLVHDLEVFAEAVNYLGACSLLDARFVAFFSFSGTELQDADFQSKRKEVCKNIRAWVDVLDRRLIAGVDMALSAEREGIPGYPFDRLEVIYQWGRFGVGATGVAQILPGYHPGVMARHLVRLNHLSRLVNEISGAYRQLERARRGQPEPTDQIRVYNCIPMDMLGLTEQHEVPDLQKQIESIIDAWGIRSVVDVRLFPT